MDWRHRRTDTSNRRSLGDEDLKPQRAISAYQSAAVECKNIISTWCSNETLSANSQGEHKVDRNRCQLGLRTKQLQVVRYLLIMTLRASRLSLSGCNDMVQFQNFERRGSSSVVNNEACGWGDDELNRVVGPSKKASRKHPGPSDSSLLSQLPSTRKYLYIRVFIGPSCHFFAHPTHHLHYNVGITERRTR